MEDAWGKVAGSAGGVQDGRTAPRKLYQKLLEHLLRGWCQVRLHLHRGRGWEDAQGVRVTPLDAPTARAPEDTGLGRLGLRHRGDGLAERRRATHLWVNERLETAQKRLDEMISDAPACSQP